MVDIRRMINGKAQAFILNKRAFALAGVIDPVTEARIVLVEMREPVFDHMDTTMSFPLRINPNLETELFPPPFFGDPFEIESTHDKWVSYDWENQLRYFHWDCAPTEEKYNPTKAKNEILQGLLTLREQYAQGIYL